MTPSVNLDSQAGAEHPQPTVKIKQEFPGVVHWQSDVCSVASKGLALFISRDKERSWQYLDKVPAKQKDSIKSSLKLTRRLFRAGIHHIALVGNDSLVVFANRNIYTYSLSQRCWLLPPSPIIGSRPLCLCMADSVIYYGEYHNNQQRKPSRILTSNDFGRTWQVRAELTGVRHIHGIFFDSFDNSLWLTTGDEDSESAIWKSSDGLNSITRVISGNQQCRAVQLLFREDYIYFGSDSPLEKNYIYRLNRQSSAVERLQQVGDSVFFGCDLGKTLCFTTACEPSKINAGSDAVLWASPDGSQWLPLWSQRKDIWPMKLFQYGQLRFPAGNYRGNRVWVSPFATCGDQTSVCLEISWN